jgi:cystathionine beta-lyase/cystathionine gamma-synthase
MRRRCLVAVRARGGVRGAAVGAARRRPRSVTDSVYGPTRNFCDTILSRYGITTTYYDPRIGGDIAALMKPNTRAVFVESPGSLSFEVQDVPAIAAPRICAVPRC